MSVFMGTLLDGSVGTGAWGRNCGDGSVGMGAWVRDCRDWNMRTGEWGWETGDGLGTEAWDNFFLVVFCQRISFFYQMIYFLTMPWSSLFLYYSCVFVRALGWQHEDGHTGTGEDGSME